MSETIDVMQAVWAENDRIADETSADLAARGVFCVDVLGAPGVGKTSCLVRLVGALAPVPCSVVEGDVESDIDTKALLARGIDAVQINTDGMCHLDAPMLHKALPGLASLPAGPAAGGAAGESGRPARVLFVENIGNLICPADFKIGEHAKILICAVTDGSDKPYKYPLAFSRASCVLVNKQDLLPHVDFDREFFLRGVRALNPDAPVFDVCARTGEGYDQVAAFLLAGARRALPA